MDERPLLTAGTPGVREYRMRFWDKGTPNGVGRCGEGHGQSIVAITLRVMSAAGRQQVMSSIHRCLVRLAMTKAHLAEQDGCFAAT